MLGAITIVAGLYLVVWGKRKDYDYPSTEGLPTDTQTMNADTKCKENINHEVVNINLSKEGAVTGDEV